MSNQILYRDRHPAGRLWNITLGFAMLIDGAVKVCSLGFLFTDLATRLMFTMAMAGMEKMNGEKN